MLKLADYDRERLVDLLCERLAFEQSSIRLYDRVIDAMLASADPEVVALHGTMEEHRDQEREHATWLESQARLLGAGATADTDCARLARREVAGLEDVAANDAADLTHLLHALLAAEAVGASGWEMLAELAQDANDREARRELSRRLHHERDHVAFVRHVVEQLAIRQIFGSRGMVDRALDRAAAYPP